MLGRKENNRIVHSQSEQVDAVFLKNQPSWRHLHKSNPLFLGLLLSMIWSLISLMQRCCSVSLELSASALDWSSIFAENGVYKPRQAGIILEAKTTVFVNPFGLEARPRVHTHILQLFFPPKQYFVSPWMFCKQITAFFSFGSHFKLNLPSCACLEQFWDMLTSEIQENDFPLSVHTEMFEQIYWCTSKNICKKSLGLIPNYMDKSLAPHPKCLNNSRCFEAKIFEQKSGINLPSRPDCTHTQKAQRFVQKYIPVDMDVCSIMCRNNKEIVAWTPKFSFVEDDLPASDYRKEVEAQKRWSLFCHPETHNRLCVISTYCIGMIGPTIHTAYWSHCFPR